MLCLIAFTLICLTNNIFNYGRRNFSVNSDFSEFDLQQLEERLETDPLAVGGLLNLTSEDTPMPTCWIFKCPLLSSCEVFTP